MLESCYGDIESALDNRLPWLPLPGLCLWPLRLCAAWLIGVHAGQMRPVDTIPELRAPTLIACGDRDREVGPGVSEALLQASGANDKHLVWVTGAGHVDLWRMDGTLRSALAGFLAHLPE